MVFVDLLGNVLLELTISDSFVAFEEIYHDVIGNFSPGLECI